MAISSSLKSFIKSSAIFTAASIFINLLGYVFHIFAGRYLGPASYSDVTTTLAYATILSVPVTVASVVIVKKTGSHADKALYLHSLLAYFDSFSRSYLALGIVYLGLSILGYFNHLAITTLILMPSFVITFVAAQLYASLLQAGKLFTPLSLTLTLTGILKLSGALLTLYFPTTAPILTLLIISNIVQIVVSRKYLFHHFSRKIAVLRGSMDLLRDSALRLTGISILGLILLNNMDIVLAKQLLPADMAGVYGVWSLFAKAITFSFIPLSSVALVFFADSNNDHNPKHILYLSIGFLAISGFCAFLLFHILSGFLVTSLMGVKFNALIPLLPHSAIFGTIYSLIYLINSYYLSKNSKLAYLPAWIAIIVLTFLAIWGNTLSSFTRLITYSTGFLMIIYPLTMYLRTKLSFSRPSQ